MMKIRNWLHPERIVYAIIGFTIFSISGYYAPQLYLRYVDDTQYVKIVPPLSFDRKVYSAGETQTAKMTMAIMIDTDITLKSRLMMILMDNQYRPIKQTETQGFVVAQKDPQTFILSVPLPCNLDEGNYLYRGEIVYEVGDNVEKTSSFDTEIFTINNNRASDSAQLLKNCPDTPQEN